MIDRELAFPSLSTAALDVITPVRNTLEAVHGLLPQPLDHAGVIVAKAHDVIKRGKAVWLA